MKLEDQVCSLELSKRLKELKVKQESLFWWGEYSADNQFKGDIKVCTDLHTADKVNYSNVCSTFTVAELGEMLPQILKLKGVSYQLFITLGLDKQWVTVYANENNYEDNAPIPFKLRHCFADALAEMLIYLLEQKIITL